MRCDSRARAARIAELVCDVSCRPVRSDLGGYSRRWLKKSAQAVPDGAKNPAKKLRQGEIPFLMAGLNVYEMCEGPNFLRLRRA